MFCSETRSKIIKSIEHSLIHLGKIFYYQFSHFPCLFFHHLCSYACRVSHFCSNPCCLTSVLQILQDDTEDQCAATVFPRRAETGEERQVERERPDQKALQGSIGNLYCSNFDSLSGRGRAACCRSSATRRVRRVM